MMTIKELKEALANVPDNVNVYMNESGNEQDSHEFWLIGVTYSKMRQECIIECRNEFGMLNGFYPYSQYDYDQEFKDENGNTLIEKNFN